MDNIRALFEKWFTKTYSDLQFNKCGMFDAFQAATLAQQAKIEALEIQVQELREALCKATRSLYGMQVPKYYSDLIDETFTPTHLQELIKVHITSALEKAYKCNESNGYNNSWDMDLIIDAVIEEFKA